MNHPFGWDLPPGVRSCDIPGNRPEDAEAERFDEAIFEILMRAHRNGLTRNQLIQRIADDWDEAIKEEDEQQAKEAAAEEEMYRQMAEDERRSEEAYLNSLDGEGPSPNWQPEDNDDPDRYPDTEKDT